MCDCDDRVRVAVRVRPRLEKFGEAFIPQCCFRSDGSANEPGTSDNEPAAGALLHLAQTDDCEQQTTQTFHFNHVFDMDDSQSAVYEHTCVPLVDAVKEGRCSTIVAYGQTGSGKTFTVLGSHSDDELNGRLSPQSGVLPRVLSELFDFKTTSCGHTHVIIALSMLEIYNDNVYDLLNEGKRIALRILPNDDVIAPRLSYVVCPNLAEALALYHEASRKRRTASTLANDRSSRSHAVFAIDVFQQKITPLTKTPPDVLRIMRTEWARLAKSSKSNWMEDKSEDDEDEEGSDEGESAEKTKTGNEEDDDWDPKVLLLDQCPIMHSRLSLVDLAGSERLRKSQASGAELKETQAINTSLSCLGTVVRQLYKGEKYISYRDSKLTLLLKQSFAPTTSKILLIANLSPTTNSFHESLTTARFADRVKGIKPSATAQTSKAVTAMSLDSAEYVTALHSMARMCADVRMAMAVEGYTMHLHQPDGSLRGTTDAELSELSTNVIEKLSEKREKERTAALHKAIEHFMIENCAWERIKRQKLVEDEAKLKLEEQNLAHKTAMFEAEVNEMFIQQVTTTARSVKTLRKEAQQARDACSKRLASSDAKLLHSLQMCAKALRYDDKPKGSASVAAEAVSSPSHQFTDLVCSADSPRPSRVMALDLAAAPQPLTLGHPVAATSTSTLSCGVSDTADDTAVYSPPTSSPTTANTILQSPSRRVSNSSNSVTAERPSSCATDPLDTTFAGVGVPIKVGPEEGPENIRQNPAALASEQFRHDGSGESVPVDGSQTSVPLLARYKSTKDEASVLSPAAQPPQQPLLNCTPAPTPAARGPFITEVPFAQPSSDNTWVVPIDDFEVVGYHSIAETVLAAGGSRAGSPSAVPDSAFRITRDCTTTPSPPPDAVSFREQQPSAPPAPHPGHTVFVPATTTGPEGPPGVVSGIIYHDPSDEPVQHEAEVQTYIGHLAAVYSAQFSPDGLQIASASRDKTLKIWEVATGNVLRTLIGHTAPVLSCSFSPLHPHQLVSASDDRTLKKWDLNTGRKLSTLRGHDDTVYCCVHSPSGKDLASCSGDRTIRVWHAESGKKHFVLKGHLSAIFSVSFSVDGNFLASSSDDRTIRVWNFVQRCQSHVFQGHSGSVWSCAFRPIDHRIVSASNDGTIRVWDPNRLEPEFLFQGHLGPVFHSVFTSEGRFLLSASSDATIKIWDLTTGQEISSLDGHPGTVYYCAAHRNMVLSCAGDVIKLWDLHRVFPTKPLQERCRNIASSSSSSSSDPAISKPLSRSSFSSQSFNPLNSPNLGPLTVTNTTLTPISAYAHPLVPPTKLPSKSGCGFSPAAHSAAFIPPTPNTPYANATFATTSATTTLGSVP